MKLIDAHTHLNWEELYPQRQEYLSKFIQAWWVWLLNSWASDAYNSKGIEIARAVEMLKCWNVEMLKWLDTQSIEQFNNESLKHLVVKASIGYHPWCCDDGEITEENIQQKIIDLKKLYEENKEYIVAIGECGIDTYYPGSENFLSLQKKLFTLQCDFAKELNLPLMVHIRKNFETAFEILKNYRDMTIYIHCRGFGPEEVERLKRWSVEMWWKLFIGFCGNVTYKNAQNLRDSLVKVPLDQLLLETDAPRLSPQVVRGTTNHPANVWYIYEFVAELLWKERSALAEQLENNFRKIYSLSN